MRRVRAYIKPEIVSAHAQKKIKSDIQIVTSTHDGVRIPQVRLAPFTDIIAKVNEVDLTKDEVRLVLISSKRVSIIIPRQQIASESILPEPDQFVSILRTDDGYKILTHPHDPNPRHRDRHLRSTSEGGDIEC